MLNEAHYSTHRVCVNGILAGGVPSGILTTSAAPLKRPMRWSARPLDQMVPIYCGADRYTVCPGTAVPGQRRPVRGSGGLFPWTSAQTERVQDWHSLDRREGLRV